MKAIKQTTKPPHWPRNNVNTVECRKRDLVIRIADWTRDKDEPAYDVEVIIGGVYDWDESENFTFGKHGPVVKGAATDKAGAKQNAIAFAQSQIAKLL